MSRTPEFLPLSDTAVRAVSGPSGRHAALIEDAFKVLIETPGGGVTITGDVKGRTGAKRALRDLSERADAGDEVVEADVRVAVGEAQSTGGQASPRAVRKGNVSPKTKGQARYMEAMATYPLCFGLGPAGTGKTFLAVAQGAGMLLRGEVDRLIVTRPAVEAGEKLGFLPGDLNEKVDPYMAPVWEALTDIMGADQLRRRREKLEIEVAPIAFMRGRTLAHAFVIVDEAQNCSRLQMKMVLTRLGEGARMVVTGDPTQVDLLNPRDSGLAHAVSILEGVEGVAVSRFTSADVVRHPLVERIVKAYDADDDSVQALNRDFRQKDYATNVLSFPSPPNPEGQIGDIALAFGVCQREAAEQGKPLGHHLQHLVAHGVLHLLGYDHQDDGEAEAMEAFEREILAGLDIPDPYADPASPEG